MLRQKKKKFYITDSGKRFKREDVMDYIISLGSCAGNVHETEKREVSCI